MSDDRLYLVCGYCQDSLVLYRHDLARGQAVTGLSDKLTVFVGEHIDKHDIVTTCLEPNPFELRTEGTLSRRSWEQIWARNDRRAQAVDVEHAPPRRG